jgi:hypothetical protein
MLLAVSIIYYLWLDASSREEFLQSINDLNTELGQWFGLLYILTNAMDHAVNATEIPPGIAVTRGLKENIFATLMCALLQIPLIIVGPPGSSKTLAVHIASDNANGSDSVSRLYSRFPRLMLFLVAVRTREETAKGRDCQGVALPSFVPRPFLSSFLSLNR